MLLGLLGIYLIAGNAWGSWIVLLSLCLESTVSVIAKRLTQTYPGVYVVAVEFLIGATLLLPFAVWEWGQASPVLTWQAIAGWLYLTVGCSVFCYGMWFRLLERYPVSAMGVLLLLQPMLGPVFGWLFRGEQMTSSSYFGGALVISGILITTWRKRKETRL
jgi:O-acetylserine/cysteine efflux transporter